MRALHVNDLLVTRPRRVDLVSPVMQSGPDAGAELPRPAITAPQDCPPAPGTVGTANSKSRFWGEQLHRPPPPNSRLASLPPSTRTLASLEPASVLTRNYNESVHPASLLL